MNECKTMEELNDIVKQINEYKTQNDILMKSNQNLQNKIQSKRSIISSQNSFTTFHQKRFSKIQSLQVVNRGSFLVHNSMNSIDQKENKEKSLIDQNFISNSNKTIEPYQIIDNLLLFGPTIDGNIDLLYEFSQEQNQKLSSNEKNDLINQIFGQLCQKKIINNDCKEDINDMVFNMLNQKNTESFFFSTQSQDDNQTYLDHKEYSLINSSDSNHFTCFCFKDFIYQEEIKNKNQNTLIQNKSQNLFQSNLVLVSKSKYPIQDFINKIFRFILKKYKLQKSNQLQIAEENNQYQKFLKKFDQKFLLQCLQEQELFFQKLFEQKLPYYEKLIFINWDMFQISFQMCNAQNSKFLEQSYCIVDIIKKMKWQNFISIFSILSQEKSIIFFSKNRELLSKFISFFSNILKPFLWSFPVIYFLQQFQYEYLDSPVPIIIGVDEGIKSFKKKVNFNELNENFFIYHIEDDILDGNKEKIIFPQINENLAKLQVSYEKIHKYFQLHQTRDKQTQLFTYSFRYLKKFRRFVEKLLVDPILNYKLYQKSVNQITQLLINISPQDRIFIEGFCKTLMFNNYIEKIKNIVNYEKRKNQIILNNRIYFWIIINII